MAEQPVEEILDEGAVPKKAAKMMTWTPPMSACLMKCLAQIAAKGAKTDKGFKEIHITKAASDVSKLVGYEVTTTQVNNHLRKWKTRWQKIDKLRTLSGALWDDNEKMIVLAEQHYLEHTVDHIKDADFLNKPLVNYDYMEACFADKLATGCDMDHAETHPDLCKTIMALPDFDMDQKLAVLDYLTEHKGKGLNFMNMEDDVRTAAFKRILAKNPDLV